MCASWRSYKKSWERIMAFSNPETLFASNGRSSSNQPWTARGETADCTSRETCSGSAAPSTKSKHASSLKKRELRQLRNACFVLDGVRGTRQQT